MTKFWRDDGQHAGSPTLQRSSVCHRHCIIHVISVLYAIDIVLYIYLCCMPQKLQYTYLWCMPQTLYYTYLCCMPHCIVHICAVCRAMVLYISVLYATDIVSYISVLHATPLHYTVMKLRWSVKRGGIIVKRIQRALAHIYIQVILLKTGQNCDIECQISECECFNVIIWKWKLDISCVHKT